MIPRPDRLGAFEFAVLAGLRVAQLTRGCVPRIEGAHTVAVTALLEVSNGTVTALPYRARPTDAVEELLPLVAQPAVML
jgi:DNA-directed RNA polymerase subunit K/omega